MDNIKEEMSNSVFKVQMYVTIYYTIIVALECCTLISSIQFYMIGSPICICVCVCFIFLVSILRR